MTRPTTLPGTWKTQDTATPAKLVNNAWQIDYSGGDPLTVTLAK